MADEDGHTYDRSKGRKENEAWLDDIDVFLGLNRTLFPEPLPSASVQTSMSSPNSGCPYSTKVFEQHKLDPRSARSYLVSVEPSKIMSDAVWPWQRPPQSVSLEASRELSNATFANEHAGKDTSFFADSISTSVNGYTKKTVSLPCQSAGYQIADKQTFELGNVSSFSDIPREVSDDTVTASGSTAVLDDACAAIGSMLENGKFKCNHANCEYRTFSRPAELKRHYTTTHASRKPALWCPFATCERSAIIGIKPFPRKDKLKDHIRQRHGHELRADGSVVPN